MSTGTAPCDTPRIEGSGNRSWSLQRDNEGHRTYKITHRVRIDRNLGGPLTALECPGLPEPGSSWDENGFQDDWAFFSQEADVKQVAREADNEFFDVTQTCSTRPTTDCATEGRNDPLTYPDRVEIESVNYSQEQTLDRFGEPILNSAWELIRGPNAEYDAHKLRVVVEQNVAALDLDLIDSLMNHLNDAVMWGFAARTIKLSGMSRSKAQYHTNCQKYFLRRLIFDIANDFDRCVLDEGTKVLRGAWDRDPNSTTYGRYVIAKANPINPFSTAPDPNNPKDFIRYKDWHGENTRVILNGHGIPWDAEGVTTGTADDEPGRICTQYYPSGNLLLLGTPLTIE